jgi:hypothetical protein
MSHAADSIRRFIALAVVLFLIGAAFSLFVRPWYLRWGATAEEVRRPLPGDEIIRQAVRQETHAITIDAPVDRVWPWIAQIGQDRGGFYSYDLLENLVGCEMPTSDYLRPDRQSWQIGGRMWMYPARKAGGMGFATLHAFVPGRALGFAVFAPGTSQSAVEDGSWAFVLEPIDERTTRFIVRGRSAAGRAITWLAFDRAIFEPMHFAMERRMMIGIKQLSEGQPRARLANHAHVVLWTITFAVFATSLVQVMRRGRWTRGLMVMTAAAALFPWLTLRQPPLIFALAATGLLVWLAWPRSVRSVQ